MRSGFFGRIAMRPTSVSALWTPLNMENAPKIYLDMQDSTVTDPGFAASAISNLGSAGSAGDFLQSTSGNRPATNSATLNGKRMFRFDGVDDRMTSGLRSVFRNSAAAWMFIVYTKRNTDSSGTPTRYLLTTTNNAGSLFRFAGLAGSGTNYNRPSLFATRLDGDSTSTLQSTTARSGSAVMLFQGANFGTRAAEIQANGSADVSNPTLTPVAGSTSDTDSGTDISLGAHSTGIGPSDVDIAAVVVSNIYPSQSDIDKLFGWAAYKYGLQGSLPGGHPYKTSPPTV